MFLICSNTYSKVSTFYKILGPNQVNSLSSNSNIWCKNISFSKCVLNWYFIIVLTLLYGFAYVWKQIWLVSDLKVRYVLCKTIWCLFIRKVSKDFQTESTLIYFIKLQMKKLVKFFANFILQKTPNEIQILFFIMV